MIYQFKSITPYVHPKAYVHPSATVIGNVEIGKDVYIGPGAILRGDFGKIEVGNGANIQENCIVHMFPGETVKIKESAHVGHGAIIHGAELGVNCLIGMNSVIMDNAIVGDECIIGALAFVPEGMEIPKRKIVVGNPAKVIKDVSDEMINWKSEGTAIYQQLPKEYEESLKEVEPLRFKPKFTPLQKMNYLNLKSIKSTNKKQ